MLGFLVLFFLGGSGEVRLAEEHLRTFELETLEFLALLSKVIERNNVL